MAPRSARRSRLQATAAQRQLSMPGSPTNALGARRVAICCTMTVNDQDSVPARYPGVRHASVSTSKPVPCKPVLKHAHGRDWTHITSILPPACINRGRCLLYPRCPNYPRAPLPPPLTNAQQQEADEGDDGQHGPVVAVPQPHRQQRQPDGQEAGRVPADHMGAHGTIPVSKAVHHHAKPPLPPAARPARLACCSQRPRMCTRSLLIRHLRARHVCPAGPTVADAQPNH